MSDDKTTINLTISSDIAEKLDNCASLSMLPKSTIINNALEVYLAKWEDDRAEFEKAVLDWEENKKGYSYRKHLKVIRSLKTKF